MAFLHLPLTLAPTGVFERAKTEENIVGSRLRMFINSGAKEYLKLPSPGIRALWIQLYTMGVSSRFCDVMHEDERRSLENIIRDEVNAWMGEEIVVNDVKLAGDDREDNGIKFQTENKQFVFYFRFLPSNKAGGSLAVGPWSIIEAIHEIS